MHFVMYIVMENILINGLFGSSTGSERISVQNANLSDGKIGNDEFLNVLKGAVEKGSMFGTTVESATLPKNAEILPFAVLAMQAIPVAFLFDESLDNMLQQQQKPMTGSGEVRMGELDTISLMQSGEIPTPQIIELLKKALCEFVDKVFSEKQKPDTVSTSQKQETKPMTDDSKAVYFDSDTDVKAILHQLVNMFAQQQKPMTGSGEVRMGEQDTANTINLDGSSVLKYTNKTGNYDIPLIKTAKSKEVDFSLKEVMLHMTSTDQAQTDNDINFELQGNLDRIIINGRQIEADIHKNVKPDNAEFLVDEVFFHEKGSDKLSFKIETILNNITAEFQKDVLETPRKDADFSYKDNEHVPFIRPENIDVVLSSETKDINTINKTSFISMIADKIVKATEHNQTRGATMDMVMRMNINEKESLLIGLKREGQQVFVEIKTESSSMLNLLQASKDTIVRNLEMKNINANIFVNPDGKNGFERRENGRQARGGSPQNRRTNGNFYELFKTEEVA